MVVKTELSERERNTLFILGKLRAKLPYHGKTDILNFVRDGLSIADSIKVNIPQHTAEQMANMFPLKKQKKGQVCTVEKLQPPLNGNILVRITLNGQLN